MATYTYYIYTTFLKSLNICIDYRLENVHCRMGRILEDTFNIPCHKYVKLFHIKYSYSKHKTHLISI